jgi:hypothetical protein
MINELDIFGIFMPAALIWAMVGGVLAYGTRLLLQRLPLERFLWQTGLLDLALFFLFWWGVSALADLLLPLLVTHLP